MKKYRIKFLELLHEDGIMSIEVLVGAPDMGSAIARATLILLKHSMEMTWVAQVTEEETGVVLFEGAEL